MDYSVMLTVCCIALSCLCCLTVHVMINRDAGEVVRGMTLASSHAVRTPEAVARLWAHEVSTFTILDIVHTPGCIQHG